MYFLKVVNGQETALSTHHYPHLTFLQSPFLSYFPCINSLRCFITIGRWAIV